MSHKHRNYIDYIAVCECKKGSQSFDILRFKY